MGFAPPKDAARIESKWTRALRATPLLIIFCIAHFTFGTSLRLLEPLISPDGRYLALSDDFVVDFTTTYFHIPALDNVVSLFTAFFTPALGKFDKAGGLQAFVFLSDLLPLLYILMIEGSRVGNARTIASRFRTAITLFAQLLGGAYVVPMYFFIHYVESGVDRYATPEKRRVQRLELIAAQQANLIAYVVPLATMFTIRGLANRQWINGVFFHPFPLYAFVIEKVLQRFPLRFSRKPRVDLRLALREKGGERRIIKIYDEDLTGLIRIYALSAITVAGVYLFTRFFCPIPMSQIFFSNLSSPSAEHTMLYGAAKVLRYDHICCFSAGAVWILLHFWDLKRAGYVTASWLRIVGILAGTTFICGPGAGMAVMWGWRDFAIRVTFSPEPELESAPHVAD
ncbi:hypothetical protein N431DRAFT_411272 [Stipitochalara longipes BDJ]|nr:hypothetical protein N431DRAFT_411272 [Stipitochalara longipes BDJ]